MELFILRHGEAAGVAPTDRERALTARGKAELRAVLERSKDELRRVAQVYVSPYVRAQQTSEIAAEYLPASVATRASELLVPEADPARLLEFLLQLHKQHDHSQHAESILLVSHQPLLGVFFDRLCGFEVGRYRLGTSALALVKADIPAAGLGELRWLRQPTDLV